MNQKTMKLRIQYKINKQSRPKTLSLKKRLLPALLLAAYVSTAHAATLTLDSVGRSVGDTGATVYNQGFTPSQHDEQSAALLRVYTAGEFNHGFLETASVQLAGVTSESYHTSTITAGSASLHITADLYVKNLATVGNDGPAIYDVFGTYLFGGHYGWGGFNSGASMNVWFSIDEPFTLTLSVTTHSPAHLALTGSTWFGSAFLLANRVGGGPALGLGYGESANVPPLVGGTGLANSSFPSPSTPGTITRTLEAGSYSVEATANDFNSSPPDNTTYFATRSVNFTLDLVPVVVLPQLIRLSIQSLTNEVKVSWNATPTNWVLEFTPDLAAPTWTSDLTIPTVQNGTNSILKAVNDAGRFWRLRYQP